MSASLDALRLPAGTDENTIFRSLFSSYPDALLLADSAGIIALANPAAASLLGYSVDELIGLPVDALVPESVRERHASHREFYGRHPRTRPMGMQTDLVARRRDGSEVPVEIALSPLQNPGASLVVVAIRDVGAYPRVKQALQRARYSESLAQLGRFAVDTRDPQILLEQVPHTAIAALQAELAVVYLLEPGRLAFRVASGAGLPDDQAIGALVPNHPDTLPGFVVAAGLPVTVSDFQADSRFKAPHAGLASGLAVPLSDRGRIIGALAVCSRQANGQGDDEVRFLESLSNLLAASLQRAQTEAALDHAQRLESVGQLTGGIAHDFNNLLTIIQGNLQVLEELPALAHDGYAQQLVGAAFRASRRGAELTGKLLAFSRRQVLRPSVLDVNALLRSLSDMLRRTLDQRIHIEVDTAPCPPCLADSGQLESALLNIAINARDAMPAGGSLRFHSAPCPSLPESARGELDKEVSPDTVFIAISISDTGTGMPDEVKERAFEPFFTTKEAGRGTGLGLSTVYGFVKQSKGAIEIATMLGSGTTVTLYLPAAEHDAAMTEADGAGGEVPPGLRVLLVEDDAEVRTIVQTFLDTLGCRVTGCASAEQALLALTPEAQFDLLLSDIALGTGMGGTQLAAQAQQRVPSLRVLLMSGFSEELLDADRDSPPGWGLLPKPCTRDELARAIIRVIKPS